MVVGRVLDEDTQSILRMLPGQPFVSATAFAASMSGRDHSSEMNAFVEKTFDAWLYFDNHGPRQVGFRVPQSVLPETTAAGYAVGDGLEGLAVERAGSDLLLRFRYYAEDDEGFNMGEEGDGWLHRILPVREELLAGHLDTLELAGLLGEYGDRMDGDLPAEYGLSKAGRALAAYLLIDPAILERWSSERGGMRSVESFRDWIAGRGDLIPVARWEFAAADPAKSFQIRLGRLPENCEYGRWYVTATEARGEPLAFATEDEARRGYHDEALRLQRLNDPGRWRELDPN
ncbi:hypothetical protein SD37_26795 [Amycolatopsis orientalis]|uniref:Uncharacterized protein n=1 Tax=Amycolatopsis orientalis TaxID=31958 RepID=A0A193C3C2_AMYOR|nr:hypothetical protein [Amycolatopsis orientalis]ANN18875.1 hypothetical protein SD37_26795 [Amycolatopsis orientalis]